MITRYDYGWIPDVLDRFLLEFESTLWISRTRVSDILNYRSILSFNLFLFVKQRSSNKCNSSSSFFCVIIKMIIYSSLIHQRKKYEIKITFLKFQTRQD